MPDFRKVYALEYNPFSLEGVLPKTVDNSVRDLLVSAPLQIAVEDRLRRFYSDSIYPKKLSSWKRTPFSHFETAMRERGFRQDPKAMDPDGRSRVSMIRGNRGTGKTTLAHRMIRWLMDCAPANQDWKLKTWSAGSDADDAPRQILSLRSRFEVDVKQEGAGGRFLCLLDDITLPADKEALQIFRELLKGRMLYFFITSYDPKIINAKYTDLNPPVFSYDTEMLTPSQAAAYCEERIRALRVDPPPDSIAGFPLFPFTSEIIQKCLSAAGAQIFQQAGPVAVRELNRALSDALENSGEDLDPDFDIAAVSPGEVPKLLIDPVARLCNTEAA